MLKMIKIDKNTIIYKSMPLVVFLLKWLDNKILSLFRFIDNTSKKMQHSYGKISDKIERLYVKKSITKIKPKYPKVKKKGK